MSVKKQFKDAIKAGNLKEAFLIAFSNNLKFQATTSIICAENNQPYSWRSKISLLEGLETKISPQLLNDKYKNINQFHQRQVNQADETWQKNRETLIKVFQILAGIPRKQEIDEENEEETFDLAVENPDLKELADIEIVSEKLNIDDFSLDNEAENKEEGGDLQVEKTPTEGVAKIETVSEELNIDDFSLDNEMENEQETLNQERENIESDNAKEEDWGDLLNGMEDMEETENINETPSESSSKLETENDQDWGEWLEEGDLSANASTAKIEEIEWEDEENWEDFDPNRPVENITTER
jgi:hypothetical protein